MDTKHSHEGDHIYLQTMMPVTANDRIVIPQGSFVNGTLTLRKPAGKVKGKGELFIRFDTVVLPNGVTRDFHSRLGSADSNARGQVDSEGKVTGERDSRGDGRTVAWAPESAPEWEVRGSGRGPSARRSRSGRRSRRRCPDSPRSSSPSGRT